MRALLTAVVVAALWPATAGAASCATTHWVGAWSAAPTDASVGGTQLTDLVDSSGAPKPAVDDATVRAVLTPTFGGSRVRVRLSNRFGTEPVTFAHTTIARQASGAAVKPATMTQVTFGGGDRRVTVPAGGDVVSDGVAFPYEAFQTLAVSVHVPQDVGKPTEHFAARQTSYLTTSGAGDAAAATGGGPFTVKTTTRPFVSGLDVRASRSTGAVVALGDSLTDGAQNQANGVIESPAGLDADVRYTDWLARRLRAEQLPLSVLNLGIGGNKLLRDGAEGGNFDVFGRSVLNRLDPDVLQQAGVTTVVLWSGINDVSQTPRASADEVIAGYTTAIERLHAAGLRVIQGTLTPFKGYPPTIAGGEADEEARRQAVNAWIRTASSADTVVDFDAVVRDPADPIRLDPADDDGEHLHLSAEGYRRIAAAIPLDALARPACTRTLTVRFSPRRLRAGVRRIVRVRVTSAAVPVAGAAVRVGAVRARTNRLGVARLRVRFTRPGRPRLTVRAPGAARRTVHLTVQGRS